MRSLCVGLVILLACTNAMAAEYFDGRFEPGYELLKQGEFDKALENFGQLKTDTPDSELVDYSIASVYYQRALSLRENDNVEGAIEQFTEAKSQFNTLSRSADEFLREHAPLNAANSAAQLAKLYNAEQQYKERVQGLVGAIVEYDSFLGSYPGHKTAQRNRDHVSFLLKQLLRNPPPEEEQDQDGEGEDSEDKEDQENQEKKDSDKDQENSEENDDESEGEKSDEEKESDSENEDSQSSGDDEKDSESSMPEEGGEGKSAEELNIEAILESLEAINAEEQKNLRKSDQYPRVKKGGKWW